MSQIVKSYLGVFLILLMALTSMGILSGYLQVMEAQNMHAQIISEVEESNFYPTVMAACFHAAEENDYKLTITLFQENGQTVVIQNKEAIPAQTDSVNMAEVALEFAYRIPVFALEQKHQLSGYAR